jgi:hypothetical protein
MAVDATKRVLYLGMATDIISPFHLIPDFETLYVINMIDFTYGTKEEHKEEILSILEHGNDAHAEHIITYRESGVAHHPELKGIIRSIDSPATDIHVLEEDEPWHITFTQNGIKRHLYYYFDLDFNHTWPSIITDIGHVIWIGANDWELQRKEPEMIRMMETRTRAPYIYALEFSHKKFPTKVWVPIGYEGDPRGELVGILQITDFSKGWWDVDMDEE